MNTRIVVAILALLASFASVAAEKPHPPRSGILPVKDSQKGRIAFVNKQSRLPLADIESAAQQVAKDTQCRVEVGSAEGAQVVIEIVDSKDEPTLTAFPEDYKARVNVAKIDVGLSGDAVKKFYFSRCRKELLRAFCFACGTAGTQYRNNIMTVAKLQDLDLVGEFIPGDTTYICQSRLKEIGVTPMQFVSYAQACRQGWAPAPTNVTQQRIWDRVREMKEKGPTSPIKISPPNKK